MNRVNFAGNDYLGLARDPRLAEAVARSAKEYGVSATSGRYFLGWTRIHDQLERELAEFMGTEDACMIGAAYLGGLNYFCTMAERFGAVFCDEMSHTNLMLGMRAARMEVRTFRHLDVADLRRQLAAYKGPRPVVVTDGVYGISGELAPVRELAEAAREHGADLFIDDAHGAFAVGANGQGVRELAGLAPDDAVVMGSMSKALGASGGFFVGRKEDMEALRHGPGSVGSTPLPPPIVGACLEALRIVRAEPERRDRVAAYAKRMRETLARHGIGVVCDRTPIVAMALRDESAARRAAEHFESRGLVIRYCKYPSEPRANLLRSVARACYTEEDLSRFGEAVAALPRE